MNMKSHPQGGRHARKRNAGNLPRKEKRPGANPHRKTPGRLSTQAQSVRDAGHGGALDRGRVGEREHSASHGAKAQVTLPAAPGPEYLKMADRFNMGINRTGGIAELRR